MKDKKFGVFDFDGTIVDTMPIYFQTSAHLISREYGLDPEEFERFSMNYTGMPTDEIFSRFLIAHDKPTDKVQENLRDFFDLVNQRDFPLIEGAKEAIEDVHRKGFTLFISTGSETPKTKERLEKAGLLKYFTLVFGSSEIEKGPEHIERFAAHSHLSREEFAQRSFFLGDGPGDMKLAKHCKMRALGVAHTFQPQYLIDAGADMVFSKIKEIESAQLI